MKKIIFFMVLFSSTVFANNICEKTLIENNAKYINSLKMEIVDSIKKNLIAAYKGSNIAIDESNIDMNVNIKTGESIKDEKSIKTLIDISEITVSTSNFVHKYKIEYSLGSYQVDFKYYSISYVRSQANYNLIGDLVSYDCSGDSFVSASVSDPYRGSFTLSHFEIRRISNDFLVSKIDLSSFNVYFSQSEPLAPQ